MDYKETSERIALLTQEIRDLQRMDTALHCYGSQRISRASRRKEREASPQTDKGGAGEDEVEADTTAVVTSS